MKPKPTTLIIVRHGQTIWNAQGRWQGWQDSPLTELGIEQAQTAATELRDYAVDRAFTSDAGRAVQTAEILAAPHGLIAIPVPELRERNYGGYEGLTSVEIEERFPGSRYTAGRDTRENWRPPDGETLSEVRDRVAPFVENLVRDFPGQTLLLVTHSGVVRVFDSICSGKSLDEIWSRQPPNACIFVLKALVGHLEVERDFLPATENVLGK
ncbi:MAG: histidine phosphatase family protein [Candidatus Sumerlaeaceae bacterium]|nr:histidine phosphatase family protein [Candidatus Sumerlaeaceae bacterium]